MPLPSPSPRDLTLIEEFKNDIDCQVLVAGD
jgi:hypothetical protein